MNPARNCFLTIDEVSKKIRDHELTPTELTEEFLERIEELDGKLNAFITVTREEARASAERATQEIRDGKYIGPLHGVPIAVKDIIATKGVRTTSGSKIFKDYLPDHDATVVERLKRAGAVIVGKLNLHEFAFGVTTQNPHFGGTRNPWDLTRIPGGSSGGSGAAVAASMCTAALGTDTGGSIRVPAALCGLVGLKPTYGRVSRYGVTPLAWSLDTVGPMAKTIIDVAYILEAIAGYDDKDQASSKRGVTSFSNDLGFPHGIKIGVVAPFFFEQSSDSVRKAVSTAVDKLEEIGFKVEDTALPHAKYGRSANFVIIACEAASYHERNLKSRLQDFGDDVGGLMNLGRVIPATLYLKVQRFRSILRREVLLRLKEFDALLTPTVPFTAPEIEDKNLDYRVLDFTSPFNQAGTPALTVNCGFDSLGLPIGMQIVGRPFEEHLLLKIGYAFERNFGRVDFSSLPVKM